MLEVLNAFPSLPVCIGSVHISNPSYMCTGVDDDECTEVALWYF